MSKIGICLWFDGQALEAAKFYVSVFKGKLGRIAYYPESAAKASGNKKGSVMTVEFTLGGQRFMGLNGGPGFKFNEAVSIMAYCKDQKELDAIWKKLTANGGREVECSWLKDKYGVSWQIVPERLGVLISGKDSARTERVMDEVMRSKKLDIQKMERAYKG